MIEMLVAMAVISLGAFALLTLVGTQQKNMKNVEQKASAQNLVQNINLSVTNVEECRVALDLEKTPISLPKTSLPGQTGSTATELRIPLSKIVLPGVKSIELNSEYEGMLLKSATLVFMNPMTPGSLRYLTDLEIVLEKKNLSSSLGASEFKRHIPLRTLFTEINPTTVLLSECYGAAMDDPQLLCEKMGGRWLASTNNAEYTSMKEKCPTTFLQKERCIMDSAFTLSRDELADNVPCDGGSNDEGERAEECYYQASGSAIVKTSLCPSYEGIRNGNRCHFDMTTKRWGMWYFKNGSPRTLRYRCDRGVKISTRAASTNQLAWNERLYLVTSSTPPADDDATVAFSAQEQLSLQETVEKCYYEPDSDIFTTCKNPTIEGSGYTAIAGSCVYVKGIRLLNPDSAVSKRINRCLATTSDPSDCPSGLDNYTGWIRVGSDYPRKISLNTMSEARGSPCFRVEINSSLTRTPSAATGLILNTTSALPTSTLKENPNQVRYCGFRSLTSPHRKGMLPCANETAGMTAENDDYVGVNASGTANDVESKLDKGTCWYFKNSPIKGVLNYTGWVRLTEALPNWGHFDILADNSMQKKATSTYVIKAEVCEQVFIDNPAE